MSDQSDQAKSPNARWEIKPRPTALGGGWRLHLTEDGEEVGGGVFPAAADEESSRAAYEDAVAEAEAWFARYQLG